MNSAIPLTVLAWEGPQARAYLARMRRSGFRPERILLMVRDAKAERRGETASRLGPLALPRAQRRQDRSHNFHPYAIRKRHPALVARIADAMAAVVDDPLGLYDEMYDSFAFADLADDVVRFGANSCKDPAVADALACHGAASVLYTGGGLVPAPVFEIPGIRIVHVHTGFLPHVRGADVLLWSLLVRGRPGVSAFLMTPGLDDGDVLAARELDPLSVPLPASQRPDDDTLYRALFSFVDPLIRAELLVADVLEPAGGDLAAVARIRQDLDAGITYHFMHPTLRSRALRHLFPSDRPAAATVTNRPPSPRRFQKYYEKVSPLAPMRLAKEAARAETPLRALSLRNRQNDYPKLVDDPRLLALHRAMNFQLALQAEQWESYDYGEGYFYQSSDTLGITGLRDTAARIEAFGLRELVRDRSVLEIGCNTGFLTLGIAPSARRVVAFELNPYLIEIARLAAKYLGITNVDFRVAAFEELETDETFDDVLSFANHHTYDGNTRQSLEDYFARCHDLTAPGGRLIFESHPPELEGDGFPHTLELIEQYYAIERTELHEYGTFLDTGRRFVVARRR